MTAFQKVVAMDIKPICNEVDYSETLKHIDKLMDLTRTLQNDIFRCFGNPYGGVL